jgi:hypothetical protein
MEPMGQNRINKISIGLVLFFRFLVGCGGGVADHTSLPPSSPVLIDPTQSLDDLGGAQISFSVSCGFAGVSDSWSVQGDGRFLAPDGSTHAVDTNQLSILLKSMVQIGLFELEYSPDPFSSCADCFSYKLSVSYAGRYREISWQDGDPELPVTLHEVQELVRTFFILDPPILDK